MNIRFFFADPWHIVEMTMFDTCYISKMPFRAFPPEPVVSIIVRSSLQTEPMSLAEVEFVPRRDIFYGSGAPLQGRPWRKTINRPR